MIASRVAVALLVALALCSARTAEGKGSHSSEQMHFSAEDAGVQTPVAVPGDVLEILRRDEQVRHVLEYENIPPEKLPPSWFSASAIHLSTTHRVDLIVMARPPIIGANIVTFWVFRATTNGYKLVLTAGAHDLIVKNRRSNGYQDIEMSAETARWYSSVLFRFNAEQYKRLRVRSKEMK